MKFQLISKFFKDLNNSWVLCGGPSEFTIPYAPSNAQTDEIIENVAAKMKQALECPATDFHPNPNHRKGTRNFKPLPFGSNRDLEKYVIESPNSSGKFNKNYY